jgi:hypothetical protein
LQFAIPVRSDLPLPMRPEPAKPQSLPNPDSVPHGWPAPMAEEARYGIAGDLLRVVEPHTECDPQALIMQLFAGFGNVVGGSPHLLVERPVPG